MQKLVMFDNNAISVYYNSKLNNIEFEKVSGNDTALTITH